LSRGDRSRPERERSHEERERDREERAHRRALRADGAADSHAPLPPPLPADAGEPPLRELSPPEPVEPAAPATTEEPVPTPVELPAHAPAEEPLPQPIEPPVPVPAPEPGAIGEPPPETGEHALYREETGEHDLHAGETAPHDRYEEESARLADPPDARRAAPLPLGAAPRARPRRGRSSGPARLAALIALLAAIAAAVLVARALVHSGHTTKVVAPRVIKLLIPEGKTRAQIAQIAKTARLTGSYRVASRHSPLLNPVHYGAPRKTPDLEGFLFPATYDVNPGEQASRLVQEQLIAFRENFGSSDISAARALHVTPYQLLTVASMIEREAQVPGDRAKIAAVIYNRMKQGMPLGIDAAIYYAVEQKKGIATYTSELTESDLHINSPYNTRTHTGLPPTPISNPGLASIRAAAHPARVSYLYYVAAADGCGEQVFSTTQAAFEANAAAYAAAVTKNGGRPPSCKHK
jgi:cell division protein YceG involved in septum cleavage